MSTAVSRKLTLCFLVVALLWFPSVCYDLTLDGTGTTYRGFPLPWNSDSLITSLATDIYLLPAVLDIAFLVVCGRFLLRLVQRLGPRFRTAITALIWVWGGLCMVFFLLHVVLFHCFFHVWPDPGPFQIDSVRFGANW